MNAKLTAVKGGGALRNGFMRGTPGQVSVGLPFIMTGVPLEAGAAVRYLATSPVVRAEHHNAHGESVEFETESGSVYLLELDAPEVTQ